MGNGWGVRPMANLHLVSTLTLSAAIPTLPLHATMTWDRENVTFTFMEYENPVTIVFTAPRHSVYLQLPESTSHSHTLFL